MTARQALQIVTNATGILELKRNEHMTLLEALQVLEQLIAEPCEPEDTTG